MKELMPILLSYALYSIVDVKEKEKAHKIIPTDREMPSPERKGTKPKGSCKKHNKKKRGW